MNRMRACFGFGALALALGLVACGDDGSANGPSNGYNDSSVSFVESEDDLPSCTESRDGSVNFVDGTKEGFVCKDRKWVHYDMLADFEENLPGCTGTKEGLTAYLYEENRKMKCVEGAWEKIGEEAGSSSSVIPSSSSRVILSESEGSSSSVASSSSAKSSSSSALIEDLSSSSSIKVSEPAEGSSSSKANWAYLNSDIDYGEFTDPRDGQVYKTVTIGTQTWMAENLNFDPGDVSDMSSFAWSGCYGDGGYDYSSEKYLNEEEVAANCNLYGRLYTWEVAMNDASCAFGESYNPRGSVQGVCPSGWHLPTKEEWLQLVKPMAYSVDGYTTYWHYNGAGVELKTVDGWSYYSSSTAGTNASGFSALPAGYGGFGGYFLDSGNYAGFWSASESNGGYAYYLGLYYSGDYASLDLSSTYYAWSVRCVQNSN